MSYNEKDVLLDLYVDQGLSMAEIADELDCSSNTVSRWANKFDIDTGRLTDEQRSNISLSEYQHELVKGVLMGDGCVQRRDRETQNPYFCVTMKNKEFIEWLSVELDNISPDFRKRKGKYAETLDNTQWTIKTYSHPVFRQYATWYSSGEKKWPTDEEITELELKMLYVTDGSPVKHPDNWAAKISAINEKDRKDKVTKMFDRSLDIDISWHSSNKSTNGVIYIPAGQADVIWDQDAVPGFEYKWPNNEQ
jgi:transposase